MSQVHTVVFRFPEGVTPRYGASTEFQGGSLVAVAFDGNRISVEQRLQEALEDCLHYLEIDCGDDAAPEIAKIQSALDYANEVQP